MRSGRACGDWYAQVVGKVDLPALVGDMMFMRWKNVRYPTFTPLPVHGTMYGPPYPSTSNEAFRLDNPVAAPIISIPRCKVERSPP